MLDFSQEGVENFRYRFFFAYLFMGVFFLVVLARLFILQVIKGNELKVFSSDHTVKEIHLPAPRGVIFDRNKIPLVQSRPSFDLVMIRQYVKDINRLKDSLEQVVGLPPEFVAAKWEEIRKQAAFYPLTLAADLPWDKVGRMRVAQSLPTEDLKPLDGTDRDLDLRGVDIIPRPLRDYPNTSASYLGYLTEVSPRDLEPQSKKYNLGDLIGAAGLERYWEDHLRGVDGVHQRIVDAVGREVTNQEYLQYIHDRQPKPGKNLFLSIDSRLQEIAAKSFQKSGALVALSVEDGGVLAMVSHPSYDPKSLQGLKGAQWQKLVSDPGKLFLNRAVQGTYPPGSTYKIITAIAALEEKVVTPGEKVNCAGGLQFGGRLFRCWNSGGHGPISLVDAIAQSCDSYFYTMGIRLGVDRLAKYATLLGLGKPTGIDLLGEKGGLIPTSQWKEKVFKTPWQPGENLSIAIGQGYDTVTPLGNALMVARVASGKMLVPHFVQREAARDPLPISEPTLQWVRKGLEQVVASPSGTAHRHLSTKFTMAGKTGTAQVVSNEAKARGVQDKGDHALFVAYAPVDHPEIAVSVVVEHGGHGGTAAAPIAKAVIEKYFELKNEKNVEGGKIR